MKPLTTLFTNKRRLSVGVCWALLVGSCIGYFMHAGELQSKPDGSITGRSSTTSPGCDCHSFSPSSSTTLSVASPSGFTVDPGGTVNLTLTVANSSKLAAGTDIGVRTTATGSTPAGTLAPASGSGLQLNGNELTHTSPKNFSGGQTSFAFTWTAPTSPGVYYIQAAGNAVDLSNTTNNDQWNWLTPVELTVPGLEVTAPNTSLTWCAGTTQNITWTAIGVTNIKIEVAADGSNFTTLVASTPASAGTWPWNIPANQTTGNQYRIRISDASNPARNDINNANFSIQVTPAITTPPTGVSTCAGGPINLSVTATGTSLSYQWRKGGVNISGAVNATYSVSSSTANDAGNYDVVVSNGCASVTSASVVVAVNTPPAITTQPTSRAACAAQPVSFSVGATGAGLTYQWRKNGTPLAGKTSATLDIEAVSSSEVGEYDVVITGSCAPPVTSTRATLTMGDPPTITAPPVAQTKCQGQSVTFSVTATGSQLSYQWQKGSNPIPGATEATYSIPVLAVNDAGNYSVVVSGLCSPPATSNAVALTVNPLPVITTQPSDQTVLLGSNATFTVVATGTALQYQWKKNGTNINGKTTATLTLNNVQNSDAGEYTVNIQNACGNVTSSVARLTVIPPGSGALISLNPSQVSFNAVRVGQPSEQVFSNMITNSGDSVLNVTAVTITGAHPGDFAIVEGGGAFDLAPGASRSMTLRFTPADSGERTATLEIASNAKNTATASLSGRGARTSVSTSTPTVNFNTVNLGVSRDTTITICNTESVAAVVTNLTLEGLGAGDYQIVSVNPALPASLGEDECITVVVRFTPSAEGTTSSLLVVDLENNPDVLTITLNGSGQGQSSVPVIYRSLAGVKVAPNPATDEASITVNVVRPSRIELTVVDSEGRVVRTLAANDMVAGARTFVWDGRGSNGLRCPSGTYRIVLRGGGELLTTPVVIAR